MKSDSPPTVPSSDRSSIVLAPLDGVRGAASLMVLVGHCLTYFAPRIQDVWTVAPSTERPDGEWRLPFYAIEYASAVTVFFILSGFTLTTVYPHNKLKYASRSPTTTDGKTIQQAFFWRRASRLLPIYYFGLAWGLPQLLCYGSSFDLIASPIVAVFGLQSVVLIGNALDAPLWTVGAFIICYIIFPHANRWLHTRTPGQLWGVIAWCWVSDLALLFFFWYIGYIQQAHFCFLLRIPQFISGMCAARLAQYMRDHLNGSGGTLRTHQSCEDDEDEQLQESEQHVCGMCFSTSGLYYLLMIRPHRVADCLSVVMLVLQVAHTVICTGEYQRAAVWTVIVEFLITPILCVWVIALCLRPHTTAADAISGRSLSRLLLSSPPAIFLGQISYALYATHFPTLSWCAWTIAQAGVNAAAVPLVRLPGGPHGWYYFPLWAVPILILVCILIATVAHRLLEAPARKVINTKTTGTKKNTAEEKPAAPTTTGGTTSPVSLLPPKTNAGEISKPIETISSPPSLPESFAGTLPISPEIHANCLSRLYGYWLNPLMRLGSETTLKYENLFKLPHDVDSAQCATRFQHEWLAEIEAVRLAHSSNTNDSVPGSPAHGPSSAASRSSRLVRPNIVRCAWRLFRSQLIWSGLCKALVDGLSFLQPVLLAWLLQFLVDFERQTERPPIWIGYACAFGLGVNQLASSVLNNMYLQMVLGVGLRLRTMLFTSVVGKTLRLSNGARATFQLGTLTQILSTDLTKVDAFVGYVHTLWSAPIQVIVAIALLVRVLGPPAIAGVGVVLVMIVLQGTLFQRIRRIRTDASICTDKRVECIREVFNAIQIIKAAAWEECFLSRVASLRLPELILIRSAAWTRALNISLLQSTPVLMALVAFTCSAAVRGEMLPPAEVFSALVLFNLLRAPLLLLPVALASLNEATIAIKRVTEVLLAEELQGLMQSNSTMGRETKRETHDVPLEKVDVAVGTIRLENASFDWDDREHGAPGLNMVESVINNNNKTTSLPLTSTSPSGDVIIPMAASSPASGFTSGSVATSSPTTSDSVGDLQVGTTPSSSGFALTDLTVTLPAGSLTLVIGASGAGKTSFLLGLLGEMHQSRGEVYVGDESTRVGVDTRVHMGRSNIAYCAQEPYLSRGTLRENLLFNSSFDAVRYQATLDACALSTDLLQLPFGDESSVGERGGNLSGGQRQRVGLFRAVYSQAPILLLDDVLSAVDSKVAQHLFHQCILRYCANRTRIFVSHNLAYARYVDRILVLENGRIVESGAFDELMKQHGTLARMMHESHQETIVPISDEKELTAETISPNLESEIANKELRHSLPTNHSTALKTHSLSESGSDRSNHLPVTIHDQMNVHPSSPSTRMKLDHLRSSNRLDHRSSRTLLEQQSSHDLIAAVVQPQTWSPPTPIDESREDMTKSSRRAPNLFRFYVHQCGGFGVAGLAFCLMCLQGGAAIWTTWWIGVWSGESYGVRSISWYGGIYSALALAQGFIGYSAAIWSAYLGIRAAERLHARCMSRLVGAPVSWFGSTSESSTIGALLNFFSHDIDIIDSQLLDSVRLLTLLWISLAAVFIIVISILPVFILPLIPVIIAYWWMQQRYFHTSRALKHLENASRAPLFAHFTDIQAGFTTIRAFGTVALTMANHARHLDAHNACYYLYIVTQRWLAVRIDGIGAVLTLAISLLLVLNRESISASSAGVVMTYALTLTVVLNWIVRQRVECDGLMHSIQRAYDLSARVEQEEVRASPPLPTKSAPVPSEWPTQGALCIRNLSVRYPTGPTVLHGIDLDVQPGESLAIVGRTGAGKSSLIAALMRMVRPDPTGTIELDGIDITTVDRFTLRRRVTLLPQVPFLFSGSIRFNLDPLNEHHDAAIWQALESVGLRTHVAELPMKLEEDISTDASDRWSHGQRAQLCLARALLRETRLLILDEATGSMDMQTEQIIQDCLARLSSLTLSHGEFVAPTVPLPSSLGNKKSPTILLVAHRLPTVMQCTRVLVLSEGRILELDTPANLLRRQPPSVFAQMVDEADHQQQHLAPSDDGQPTTTSMVADMKKIGYLRSLAFESEAIRSQQQSQTTAASSMISPANNLSASSPPIASPSCPVQEADEEVSHLPSTNSDSNTDSIHTVRFHWSTNLETDEAIEMNTDHTHSLDLSTSY